VLGLTTLFALGAVPGAAATTTSTRAPSPASSISPCKLLTTSEVESTIGLSVKAPYLFTSANCVWDTANFGEDVGGEPYARVATIFQPYSGSGTPVIQQDEGLTAQLGVPATLEVSGPQEGPFPMTRITLMNGLQTATIDYARCDVADVAGGCANGKGSTTPGAVALAKLMLPRVPFIAPPQTAEPEETFEAPVPTETTAAGPAPPAAVTRHARPAVFASRLPSVRNTFADPTRDLLNLLLAFAVLLFVTFPAELFNKTFEEHYTEIRTTWRRWLHLPPATEEPRKARIGPIAAVLLAGALLGALLDPHAGFNLTTALALLATLVTIAVFALLRSTIERVYRRRHGMDRATVLRALPGGLAVAAACVLFSRLLDFQPGYLYGVVAAVAFSTAMPRADTGRVSALAHGAQLILGLLAWLAWLPVHDAGSTWPVTLATDILGALFVGALVSTTLTLLPLRFLDGGHIFAWRRAAWSALFLTSTFLMLAVMLNPNSSDVDSGPSNWVLAIVLLVLFGAASAGFALYWQRRDAIAARSG
jgi:hypothetical protein